MRIGFLTPFATDQIAFARDHGFGSIELIVAPDSPGFPGTDGWPSRAIEIVEAWRAAGVRVSCLGGFYVNHFDPAKAADHAERVRNTILLAERVGVACVGGFAGRVMGEPLERSLPMFTRVWSEHAKFAAEHGIRIALEHCPMGYFHTPEGGINCICTPLMWERCFDAVSGEAIGLEWDASHLICAGIDPVENVARHGRRIFHVHAKDARIRPAIADLYGPNHPDAAEHCFPGFGDADWPAIIRELLRQGYRGDLNIEGWHDRVLCDDESHGRRWEDDGLRMARRFLGQFVPLNHDAALR